MRYVFKVLILGEPEANYDYVVRAFQDKGENKETYFEWYREVNALEDICDLELNVITDEISAEYDMLIPTVDGIIYFMNPRIYCEYELFEMNLQIINKVKRNIPIILILYDKKGLLPVSINEFLEAVWRDYPDLEVFINLSPDKLHQALECLNLAMISGDRPLNIENAWMRFPIFIELANKYFQQQQYFYAAQTMKKAAIVSEIYHSNEFFIHCEQTAYLFSKAQLYLEASNILNKFDHQKASDFKRLYHMMMLKEGNLLFNKENYESAAAQYENAAQWASIELEDNRLISESFKLAINSWISSCKVEKAFKILEKLPQKEITSILNDITVKILNSADYLASINNIEHAREQLYYSIYIYQKEGLFEDLKKFAKKLIDLLIESINQKINERDIYNAKKFYDEIENLWEAFDLEKINLDQILETLIKLFLDQYNFNLSSLLINKLNSLELKKNLTELSLKTEEKTKALKKKEIEKNLLYGIEILKKYVEIENNIVAEMNLKTIAEADEFVKKKEYAKAAKVIKNHSIHLINIGKNDIAYQITTKSLDILINANLFEKFFEYYNNLSEDSKKSYLLRIYPRFLEKFEELRLEGNYNKKEKIFEIAIKKLRDISLYEESKDISKIFIKEIKKEALRILEIENNLKGIVKSTDLIKKISGIITAYFEDYNVNLDKIYKKIAGIYINIEDYYSAQSFNEKINNKQFKFELHERLAKLEAKKGLIKSEEIEKSLKGESLKEKLSLIKKKGEDAKHDREKELKQREALKRTYFNEILNQLKQKNYDKAIEAYKESIIRLNRIKKYYLAGVSLAFASFILLKKNRIEEMIQLSNDVRAKSSSSEKLFSETFPIVLIEYIIDMKKFQEESKLNETLTYFEYLPLFKEEIDVLYEFLDKEHEIIKEEKKDKFDRAKITEIRSKINYLIKSIEVNKQEFAKRKIMKNEYWKEPLNDLLNKNLKEAYNKYLELFSKLISKNFDKQATLALIICTIIQIKEKNIEEAKINFNNTIGKLSNYRLESSRLPELQLMDYLFMAHEHKFVEFIELILNGLLDKLTLFEPEIDLIKNILGEETTKIETEQISRSINNESLVKIEADLENLADILNLKMRDIKSDIKDFLTKRKAMKRRIYSDILIQLEKYDYIKASELYFENMKKFFDRKDYDSCSLLILLTGLAAINSKIPIEQIIDKINSYLDSLGINKAYIEETFYVSLLKLILESKFYNLRKFDSRIKEFLNILPVFEEEKKLRFIFQ